MNKKPCYIFDIDGTLANITHRVGYIANKPKNWAAFERGIKDDVPNKFVVDLYHRLNECRHSETETAFDIILCSGRGEQNRKVTEEWMNKHGIEYDALYMRGLKDYRRDDQVKPELWKQIEEDGYEILAMFDDRQQVVDKARELGYKVFQVAEGDF